MDLSVNILKPVFILIFLSLSVLLFYSLIKSNHFEVFNCNFSDCDLSAFKGFMQYSNAAPEGNYTSEPAPEEDIQQIPPPDYTAPPDKKHDDNDDGKKKGDNDGDKKVEPPYVAPTNEKHDDNDGSKKKKGDNDGGSAQFDQPQTVSKSGCLIATAAFGSEISPQVQFLRNFRDNRILSTVSGSSFMNVFNTWYYSFSPSVADYERERPWLQGVIRMAIYPLLQILQLSEKSYSLLPGEYGSVVAGLTASTLIGLIYFTPISLGLKMVKTKTKLDFKVYAIIIFVVTVALVMALFISNEIALMITTTLFILTLCAISSILGARMIEALSASMILGLKMLHRSSRSTT